MAKRVLHPTSKLGTLWLWEDSTLATGLSVTDAVPDELYKAMDWLLACYSDIEAKLAKAEVQ